MGAVLYLSTGCSVDSDVSDKPCPCAEGFTCVAERCVPAFDASTERDSAMPDAGMDDVDAGPRTPAEAAAAYLAGVRDFYDAACTCRFAAFGYADHASCLDTLTWGNDVDACFVSTLRDQFPTIAPSLECELENWTAATACIEDGGCEGMVGTCERDVYAQNDRCGFTGNTYANFTAAVAGCLQGDPQPSCPEASEDGVLGDGVFTGTTLGGSRRFDGSCAIRPGAPERTFEWTPPADGTYVFSTLGSHLDTTLYLLESCGGAEIACNDDAILGQLLNSELTVDLTAGQPVIVVVDASVPARAGDFTVSIRAL